MMNEITLNAYGKVNLGLDVVGRRADGYHLVRMVMQTVDLHDEVCVQKMTSGIEVHTNLPGLPCDERNLAYRAAAAVMTRCGIEGGVRISIQKQIPMEAGMAGGSTDAAAVIKAMKALYVPDLDARAMDEIAVSLGADVPFCLREGTYLAEGIGEELVRLPDMPQCHCLLINPGFGVSTKWAYDALDALEGPVHPDMDAIIRALGSKHAEDVAYAMGNILEQAVFPEYPQLKSIKEELKANGAMGALMSGSGATVFGLFETQEAMEQACKAFEGEHYGKFKTQFR